MKETSQALRQLRDQFSALGWSNLAEFRQVRQLQRVTRLSLAMCRVMRRRQESRGTHIRTDFPQESADWKRKQAVYLDKDGEIRLVDLPL